MKGLKRLLSKKGTRGSHSHGTASQQILADHKVTATLPGMGEQCIVKGPDEHGGNLSTTTTGSGASRTVTSLSQPKFNKLVENEASKDNHEQGTGQGLGGLRLASQD